MEVLIKWINEIVVIKIIQVHWDLPASFISVDQVTLSILQRSDEISEDLLG